MSEIDNLDDEIDRRTLLQSTETTVITTAQTHRRGFLSRALALIGGTVLGISRFSNPTKADLLTEQEQAQMVARQFASPDAVRKAMEEHAGELLVGLANDGYIPSPTVGEFTSDELYKTIEGYVEADEGVFISASLVEGTPA